MNRLIIVGDSLSMPRIEDGLLYANTYPYLLQEYLGSGWHVINRSRRSNTSRKQAIDLHLSDDIRDLDPDILVYHIGIVDCAPRLFSELQQRVLEKIPHGIRSRIIRFFSRRRAYMTRRYPKVFVSQDDFRKNVLKTLRMAKEHTDNIIVVGIGMPASKVLARSYGFRENVLGYNNILKEISNKIEVNFIDTVSLLDPEMDLLKDGYHFNGSANNKIFEVLRNYILSYKHEPSSRIKN